MTVGRRPYRGNRISSPLGDRCTFDHVTRDPLGLSDDIEQATGRLLDTVRQISDVSAPSLLPDWTVGHVITHVARNANGAINLLTWARTGVVTPQYENQEKRAADVEAGAARPAAVQQEDLTTACAQFADTVRAMPAEAWSQLVRTTSGTELTAAEVMWSRLREVEIHHVDLGLGYTPADWPEAFSLRMAHTLVGGYTRRADGPRLVIRSPEVGRDLVIGTGVTSPVVSGPVHTVVAWLIGRRAGDGLTVQPPGSLPVVPVWS